MKNERTYYQSPITRQEFPCRIKQEYPYGFLIEVECPEPWGEHIGCRYYDTIATEDELTHQI